MAELRLQHSLPDPGARSAARRAHELHSAPSFHQPVKFRAIKPEVCVLEEKFFLMFSRHFCGDWIR